MSSIPLQARSTTEIVDAAVQIYRRDATRYMLLAAIAYTPLVAFQFVFFGTASPSFASWTGGIAYLLTVAGFGLMSAALARMAAGAIMGENVDVDQTIREVLPRVPAVIGSTVLKYVMFMIGLVLLVVPGLYVVTRYFATTQAVVLEQKGVVAAFSRSSVLSNGIKRHVFNTLMLMWIIYFVVSFAATMLAMVGGTMVVTIVSALVTIVAYPVVAIGEVVLYYDTRIRQEGYDIEVMAGSVDRAAAAV